MPTQTPVSDHVETFGIIYFARMVDKIRLRARGVLPPGYNLGVTGDPTAFDARFCRFWEVSYDEIAAKTLEGADTQAVFTHAFRNRPHPNDDQKLVWNSFLAKRGWRDSGSPGLVAEKAENGWAARDDIQTYVDLHDVEEGRAPRHS